jgi:hypothetical protein
MTTVPFLRPRLVGARFEGHAIPLEFLKDLAVFEEMIVEVAKAEFLKDHPSRKRSPRGFTEGIELKLTGIEDGSVIPVISLVVAARMNVLPLPPDNQTYFERARDAVISAIGAAEGNQSITDHLPEKTLGYFDRIGRSLRDGEAIEFTPPEDRTPARLTKETRRKLVLASSAVKELTEETYVRGAVPEADQDDMTFEVQLIDGRKVRAPIATPHLDAILEAFNGYKSGTRVLLQGIGRFSRNDRLLGFESIEHVSILDLLDISARLDDLRLLQPGWLEGQGEPPAQEGLDWLSSVFNQQYPDDLPLPFLYPTAEGGIQAEWSLAKTEVTFAIDLTSHVGQWHALRMDVGAEETRELNLGDTNDWQWLIEQLQRMVGAAG